MAVIMYARSNRRNEKLILSGNPTGHKEEFSFMIFYLFSFVSNDIFISSRRFFALFIYSKLDFEAERNHHNTIMHSNVGSFADAVTHIKNGH